MKLDPNKPITCKAAEDVEIVGPLSGGGWVVYSRYLGKEWRVDNYGLAYPYVNDMPGDAARIRVRNIPEITAEHWVAHYPNTVYGPYSTFRHCRTHNAGAQQYTRHWLEDGEPKCEVVKKGSTDQEPASPDVPCSAGSPHPDSA